MVESCRKSTSPKRSFAKREKEGAGEGGGRIHPAFIDNVFLVSYQRINCLNMQTSKISTHKHQGRFDFRSYQMTTETNTQIETFTTIMLFQTLPFSSSFQRKRDHSNLIRRNLCKKKIIVGGANEHRKSVVPKHELARNKEITETKIKLNNGLANRIDASTDWKTKHN